MRGDYLLFLDSDIDVIDADWLSEMMRHPVRPGIGGVGAKLLYPDGRVQHGGVGLGPGGVAGHVEKYASGNAPGYFGQLAVTGNVSAVTAARIRAGA